MKKKIAKLTLNRETLRHLSGDEVVQALGGLTQAVACSASECASYCASDCGCESAQPGCPTRRCQ